MPASALEYEKRIGLFSKVNRLAVSFHNANTKHKSMAAIDLTDDEVLDFLKSLEHHSVKYLLVGGFAMAFHGFVRATNDLDLWIKDETENLEKFKHILMAFGVPGLDSIRTFDLVPGFTQFAIGTSGFVVDPMKNLKSFSKYDFANCYARAEEGTYRGVTFKVIHSKDLLREKEAINRPKDQGDIEHLRSL